MGNPFGFNPVDLTATPAVTLVHIGYCKVNAIAMYNHSTAIACLQIWDLGRLPVLGVDKPTWQFGIGGGATANQGSPPVDVTFIAGLKCTNGFAYALTQNLNGQSGGSTLLAANTMSGTIDWEIRP